MDSKQKFLLYLYSTPNIVGSLLGLVGLALHFIGLIGPFWLPIVVGLYLIGVLATPRSKTVDLRITQQLNAEEIKTGLDQLVSKIRRKVSKDILDQVISIRDSILELLPYITAPDSTKYGDGSFAIYTIRQTALEYLPETLENYLRLPSAYARMHPIKDGKTAHRLLMDQLEILDTEMKAIVEDIVKNDAQRLMTHGRFLEEKFKKPQDLFGITG